MPSTRSLQGDIESRIKRLPKPSNATNALQPVFEAISNAYHAIDDKFKDDAVKKGRVDISVDNNNDPKNVVITVEDNGIGLDENRFDAFCTTDTNWKIEKGGKGVGRLLWLDMFASVHIQSTFRDKEGLKTRSFEFSLGNSQQIKNHKVIKSTASGATGTIVTLSGIRQSDYLKRFPVRAGNFTKHFGSHFFSDFILQKAPKTHLTISNASLEFPEHVLKLLVEERDEVIVETKEFGDLRLKNFICLPAASSDLEGDNQLHYIANDRTVISRKIDGLIGFKRFGKSEKVVFHGCVSGDFLDKTVNQERTNFTFSEAISKDIAKACAKQIRKKVLKKETKKFDGKRKKTLEKFLDEYPSFGFASSKKLLSRVPKNAVKEEQFARALIPLRIRRDIERKKTIQKVVDLLASEKSVPDDFQKKLSEAVEDVKLEEQRQLTEYVLRRKVVLEVLDVLIRRVRILASGKRDFQLEESLHEFICPMKLRGDDPSKIEASDHDLWVLDERLVFSKYFASDVQNKKILEEGDDNDRPDLYLFDRLHGLGIDGEEPLTRVMLVEFKKPGKKTYQDKYLPNNQILRYIAKLKGQSIESFEGEPIRLAPNCVFHCFIVADIIGNLKDHVASWDVTANGRGRWLPLRGDYRGSIEVIEWKDLVKDAMVRNKGFINAVGL